MKKFIPIIFVMALILSGCNINISSLPGVEGSGNIVEVKPEVDSFSKLEVHNAFDLVVSRGENPEVVIDIDDNLAEYLNVYVRGDKLHIGMKTGVSSYRNATFKAYVSLPLLEEVDGSGATSTVLEDGLSYGERMIVDLSGASEVKGNIESEKVRIDLSGASDINGEVKAADVEVNISGASEATLSGYSDHGTFELSGSSSLNASEFNVKVARIDLSSASDLKLAVSDVIDIEASGASGALIYGHPSIEKQEISGAAEVEFK